MTAPSALAARDPATEAAYEQLRRSVSDSTSGGHLGLALLVRGGIAAWMAQGSTRASMLSQQTPKARDAQRAAVPLELDEFHVGIVRVLASIALAREEARRTT